MPTNIGIEELIQHILQHVGKAQTTSIQQLTLDKEERIVEPMLFGLFSNVIIGYFQDKVCSLELRSDEVSEGCIENLATLTNTMHDILKGHTVGNGRFSLRDAKALQESKTWAGKLWSDYSSGSIILLLADGEELKLTLTYGGYS